MLKVKGYRKKTHMDQYLCFECHHPLPHMLGIIRTLYDRADNIVMEPEHQKQEISHINNALRVCCYPNWSFKEVRERMDSRETNQQKEKRKKQKENNGGQGHCCKTLQNTPPISKDKTSVQELVHELRVNVCTTQGGKCYHTFLERLLCLDNT